MPMNDLPSANLEASILEAIYEDILIAHKHFDTQHLTGIDASKTEFDTVQFHKCRFSECTFEHASFVNSEFHNCDFSNCSFSYTFFKNVLFDCCKGLGTKFQDSYFKQVKILDSNFDYSNLHHSKLEKSTIQRTSFANASIAEAELKSLSLKENIFEHADFFKTPLKGLDLSECTITNILISDNLAEVKGARLNVFQAAELAKILGVIIV